MYDDNVEVTCVEFDSAALLLSCVVVFVGQLKHLLLTVVHWPTTTAFCQLCHRRRHHYHRHHHLFICLIKIKREGVLKFTIMARRPQETTGLITEAT